jgi:prophage antirepressor-like protein
MQMTIIELLNDPQHGLTTLEGDDGPHIIASTLAAKLGYPRTDRVLGLVLDDEKGQVDIQTPVGTRRVYYLTLPGMLRAMGSRTASRIPDLEVRAAVEEFQNWVWRDVVLKVILTGHYETQARQERFDMAMMSLRNAQGKHAITAERALPTGKAKDEIMRTAAYVDSQLTQAIENLSDEIDPTYNFENVYSDSLRKAIDYR